MTEPKMSCPHCQRAMRPTPFGDIDRWRCPLCHAELAADGSLLTAPTPGPRSLEDVLWDIHEQAQQKTPASPPDYRP